MKDFSGRAVVVTGAAQGIGYEIAKKFIRENVSKLAILDWNADLIEGAKLELSKLDTEAEIMALQCDVSDEDSVNAAFKKIEENFGKVDVLVNNAGIIRDAIFHKMTFKQWDDVLKVNLYGAYYCCKAVMPGMRAREYGRIVNLSSVSGIYGNAGQANYATTKAGIIGMTKTLAREGGSKNITVNAVAPHFVASPMMNSVSPEVMAAATAEHPMHRLGLPEEVASLIVFLANEEASYVSGTCITCSGAART